MFGLPYSDSISIASDAPTIAGTTTIDSSVVDLSGYSGVIFVVRLGTAAANNNIRVQQDTDSGMGAAADLAGTLVASGSNNVCAVEVIQPGERYVRCRVTRGTSTTIDSIVAIRVGSRSRPTSQPAAVSFESWVGPAEGTA